MIRPGDARREAQLAERRIRPVPVDTDAPAMHPTPGPASSRATLREQGFRLPPIDPARGSWRVSLRA
jgi:hypothetical protein